MNPTVHRDLWNLQGTQSHEAYFTFRFMFSVKICETCSMPIHTLKLSKKMIQHRTTLTLQEESANSSFNE